MYQHVVIKKTCPAQAFELLDRLLCGESVDQADLSNLDQFEETGNYEQYIQPSVIEQLIQYMCAYGAAYLDVDHLTTVIGRFYNINRANLIPSSVRASIARLLNEVILCFIDTNIEIEYGSHPVLIVGYHHCAGAALMKAAQVLNHAYRIAFGRSVLAAPYRRKCQGTAILHADLARLITVYLAEGLTEKTSAILRPAAENAAMITRRDPAEVIELYTHRLGAGDENLKNEIPLRLQLAAKYAAISEVLTAVEAY